MDWVVGVDFVPERHLSSVVVGLSKAGDGPGEPILLTYSDGTIEHSRMSIFNASRLAESHGLVLVPSPYEMLLWR